MQNIVISLKKKSFVQYLLTMWKRPSCHTYSRIWSIFSVWDQYVDGSLKSTARYKRGTGKHIIVKRSNPIPKSWHSFHVNEIELNSIIICPGFFLSLTPTSCNLLDSTQALSIVSSTDYDIAPGLPPSNQKEVVTRTFLHMFDCGQTGYWMVLVKSVDTDFVVLWIALFQELPVDELWIAFGVKKHYCFIPAYSIA